MSKNGIIMIGCAALAAMAVGAAGYASADTGHADGAQAHAGETDTAAASPGVAPRTIGLDHIIRLANTQFCLQPQTAGTGDTPIVLQACDPNTPFQNWQLTQVTGGTLIINLGSGRCLYNAGSSPPVNGTGPVMQEGCYVDINRTPASNALWQLSSLTNLSTLTTLIGHHNTGFCLDVPGGTPFAGASVQIYQCNNSGAQEWVVGVE